MLDVRTARLPGTRLGQALRQLLSWRTVIVAGCVLVVGFLAVVPLYHLVRDTFTGEQGFTLGAFARAYGGDSQSAAMLRNSMVFAVGAALLALVLGTTLAYIQVRTDTPFKGLFFAASLVPLSSRRSCTPRRGSSSPTRTSGSSTARSNRSSAPGRSTCSACGG
jgi:ABC-type Fe3+ transport system permease subunit